MSGQFEQPLGGQDSASFAASKRIQPQLDAMKQAWLAMAHLSGDEMETVLDFLGRQVAKVKCTT